MMMIDDMNDVKSRYHISASTRQWNTRIATDFHHNYQGSHNNNNYKYYNNNNNNYYYYN